MSDDIPLEPTPIEVESYVALLTNPLVGSALLALPVGLLAAGASMLGLDPSPVSGPAVDFVFGWFAGLLVLLFLLARPY